jgi:hypothetical protein
MDRGSLAPIKAGTMAVADTAIGLTNPTTTGIPKPRAARITIYDANIRYLTTGDNPTATTGHRVAENGEIFLESWAEIAGFKAIREGSTSAVAAITFYV